MTQVATTLTTDRLVLRAPQAEDLPAYTAYCTSERSRFVGGPFRAPQAFDKFAAIIGHWTLRGFGRYVMIHEGTAIGHVGPLAMDTTHPPEMTWTIWDATFEGRGLAREAARAVWSHLRHDCNWPEMIIRIQPENTGSIAIARHIGARQTNEPAPSWFAGALTFRLTAEVPA